MDLLQVQEETMRPPKNTAYNLRLQIADLTDRINKSRDNFLREELAVLASPRRGEGEDLLPELASTRRRFGLLPQLVLQLVNGRADTVHVGKHVLEDGALDSLQHRVHFLVRLVHL